MIKMKIRWRWSDVTTDGFWFIQDCSNRRSLYNIEQRLDRWMRLRIRLGIILNMDDVASMDAIRKYVGLRSSVVLARIMAQRGTM
jgi:hypothetical protein